MLTIGSMIALFDAGFSPMFGKNITYLFSGAQELKKEGVAETHSEVLNYHLIATMLEVAKMVYRRLSVLVLLLMLTIGTIYIYYVTDGFSSVKHSLAIWCVYSFSTFCLFQCFIDRNRANKGGKKSYYIISYCLYYNIHYTFVLWYGVNECMYS